MLWKAGKQPPIHFWYSFQVTIYILSPCLSVTTREFQHFQMRDGDKYIGNKRNGWYVMYVCHRVLYCVCNMLKMKWKFSVFYFIWFYLFKIIILLNSKYVNSVWKFSFRWGRLGVCVCQYSIPIRFRTEIKIEERDRERENCV